MKNTLNPFQILNPNQRWVPKEMRFDDYEKFLPPLVHKIRLAVLKWRDNQYLGASKTSKSLLNFWFNCQHQNNFQFFFSQRESIESIIYLQEIAQAKDKYELMRFDSSNRISTGMFDENWTRYVVKMATGAGKTKVIGLTLVWCYFHKLYEKNSQLSQNFLVIAPNIIVLNRLLKDFAGLKMFLNEPFIPQNGFDCQNWQNDFTPTLHVQDDLKQISDSGNIFLTNIHRVFFNQEPQQNFEEIFCGTKPKINADTSKNLDLGKILRSNKIENLVVLNDEAHHIHDENLAWFKNIADISNKLKLKNGSSISLQADFSATPKHNNGAIFVQTICDYPLVEAIKQNVVKMPVLPDLSSRHQITEKESSDFVERYRNFIDLGYQEWHQQYQELKSQKTPILFVMTNNTKEADEAAQFLESNYPLMKNAVLTIHTNNSGQIKENENSKKNQEDLEKLRNAANQIDSDNSPYKAVVSVLMLREGWDVRNVTTIVGLRAFNSKSKILPEQTIGRGLRKMFSLETPEKLVVIGTTAFLEFVESLKTEGVEFEYSSMGKGSKSKSPMIIEVDKENQKKNLDQLDIPIPQMTARVYREFKNLDLIDVGSFKNPKIALKTFDENQLKEIIFVDSIDGEYSHTTTFQNSTPNYRNLIGYFTAEILKQSRLFSGFDVLYPKVESFIKYQLFTQEVELSNPQILRNLAELPTKETIKNIFKKAIDQLTVQDKGKAEVKSYLSLKNTKPKIVENQRFLPSSKSIFNKTIGDNEFELEIAAKFENFADVISYAKNTYGEGGVNFKIEYQASDGNIRDYFPDFFVKTAPNQFFIVEAKGREDLNDERKIKRLISWCHDINSIEPNQTYTPIYVTYEKWEKIKQNLKNFADLKAIFEMK